MEHLPLSNCQHMGHLNHDGVKYAVFSRDSVKFSKDFLALQGYNDFIEDMKHNMLNFIKVKDEGQK